MTAILLKVLNEGSGAPVVAHFVVPFIYRSQVTFAVKSEKVRTIVGGRAGRELWADVEVLWPSLPAPSVPSARFGRTIQLFT